MRARAAAVLLVSLWAAAAWAQERPGGHWQVDGAPEVGGVPYVQLTFMNWTGTGTSLQSRRVELRHLEGLAPAVLEPGGSAPARFRLRRDAGVFTFVGSFSGGRGRGEFTFAPDAAFAEGLARRGIGRPTPAQQLSLALHDVGMVYVDELERLGYRRPTVDELIRAGKQGAGLDYLRELAALGFRAGSVPALVEMRGHRVEPGFVRELRALGYASVSPGELVEMKDHGVTPEFVRRANQRAGRRLPPATLIELRSRGDG
ncbi:MAG TPA: hypothetical protein VGR37_02775 [Longimicrobiaceae bacterium]|nr:hypothetical protein [Longimicrobiaceae bacterium]